MNRFFLIVSAMTVMVSAGCSSVPSTESGRSALTANVLAAIEKFKAQDETMVLRFEQAQGYAVFPRIGKGALGVGGAYGRGQVFAGGEMIGYTDLAQVTIGPQLGGQAYSEVIFFEDKLALSTFQDGKLVFAAQASAVAASSGSSADADYENGVVVFTMAAGGLMFEASIGGQNFDFVPLSDVE